MSLRLFCDQCVPAEISEALGRAGHDVTLLRDALPIRSPDPVVINRARELDAILVSLNGQATSDVHDVLPALEGGNIGRTIPAQIVRAGEARNVEVQVGERR